MKPEAPIPQNPYLPQVPTFQESDLLFTFPDTWTVRKFDETAAYKSLSGHGLKGVDFIALSPDDKLWLIEVKNYRPRKKGTKEYRANRRRPDDLAAQIVTKFHDSIRLINVVNTYLHRSWYKRAIIWYRNNIRANRESNYWFWHAVQQLCIPTKYGTSWMPADGGTVEYVLWMETPEQNDDYDFRTYEAIVERMPPEASVIVAENSNRRNLPISATPVNLHEAAYLADTK